jgi:serine/threonine protein kinase
VTSLPPFLYEVNDKFNLTEVENMLFQMITITNDEFEPSQLRQSPLAIDYFNPKTCEIVLIGRRHMADLQFESYLSKNPELTEWSFEAWLTDHGIFSSDQTQCTLFGNFLRRCLRLDPTNRPSAKELLDDPWFEGVD